MPRLARTGMMLLMLAMVALPPFGAVAQETAEVTPDLAMRLPATIDGQPVEVAFIDNLQTSVDELYAGEIHPEIEALQAALAGQARSLADVAMVSAYFGAALEGEIQGFQVPGVDTAELQDALAAVYLIGFGELERTQQDIGGQLVTVLSDGPFETAAYPTALLPDGDALWIVTGDTPLLQAAVEALVASGEAPGNSGVAPSGVAPSATPLIGPQAWEGTMDEEFRWNREGFVGETTVAFRGAWERLAVEDSGICNSGSCVAYVPTGTVDWTFESDVPSNPRCYNKQSGSLSTGDVVVPEDQMLFLRPAGPDHLQYWGSGRIIVPPQKCPGWDGAGAPAGFFLLYGVDADGSPADESTEARPDCGSLVWRIKRDAATMSGTCWIADYPGFEHTATWDLRSVEQP